MAFRVLLNVTDLQSHIKHTVFRTTLPLNRIITYENMTKRVLATLTHFLGALYLMRISAPVKAAMKVNQSRSITVDLAYRCRSFVNA
jgi:hypothetical protein